MENRRSNIRSLSLQELTRALAAMGEPAFRARQLHQWLFSHGAGSFGEMTNLGAALRKRLDDRFSIEKPRIVQCDTSDDEGGPAPTEKLLLQLEDGALVESVLIPGADRLTGCVSSQVGCQLGCTFCATGSMGFRRNLTPGEITGQVEALNTMLEERGTGRQLSNVVFMGMGEPLLNTPAVLEAVETLSREGYRHSISQRRITISTVGIVPEIEALAARGLRTKLALSLHAADQRKRESLIPVAARRYPLDELKRSLAAWSSATGQPVTLAYMLVRGLNDTLEDARLLARFARGLFCKINLIDYNPILTIEFKPVYGQTREMFRNSLQDAGLQVTVRKSYGTTINAACGQLATRGMQERRNP